MVTGKQELIRERCFFRLVTSVGQRKILSPHKESNLKPSDSTLRWSNHWVFYEVHMTRVLHTARISNVYSVISLMKKRSLIRWGWRVPIWKINFSFRVLRLCELPRCKERPQAAATAQNDREIEVSSDWFGCVVSFLSTLRWCSRIRSLSEIKDMRKWIPQVSFVRKAQDYFCPLLINPAANVFIGWKSLRFYAFLLTCFAICPCNEEVTGWFYLVCHRHPTTVARYPLFKFNFLIYPAMKSK